VLLSLYHDQPSSEEPYKRLLQNSVLERLRVLDSRVRRKGLASLDPARNPLIGLGMEIDAAGHVTRNGYGVFSLAWQAEHHAEWPESIQAEMGEARAAIREAHDAPLRFLIWAGMGGSAEDKSMYAAAGLLKRGPRCYVVDSTDPAKLCGVFEDIQARTHLSMPEILRSSLVVGMALGMTSYEPVVNLERLEALYRKHKVDPRANFLAMTLAGSLLDEFAKSRCYRSVGLQLDGENSTAGRHSGPLTRGSLYPLALCGADLRAWIAGACLSEEYILKAWRLAAFLHAQSEAGRDKATLLLPKVWQGAGTWTKQDFEESLGKAGYPGIKIVIGERPKLANYRPPKDALQDRVFLAVQHRGTPHPDAQKIALLRRAGYPVAVLSLPGSEPLSAYMQFIHYAVFGMACLRGVNFVTQPGVELYKSIAGKLHGEAVKAGGIEKTKEWRKMAESPCHSRFRMCVTLRYDRLPGAESMPRRRASEVYAALLGALASARKVDYGELTFFGDTRYSPQGRALRKILDRAGEELFRARLKMPVDVYEGPAMNHSYHEMIIGRGRCFSTVLISEKLERTPEMPGGATYHRAQYLATQMALAEKGCPVVSITLGDLSDATLAALEAFFHEAAAALKNARR
jgi:glucose-6-phosphate isomerase